MPIGNAISGTVILLSIIIFIFLKKNTKYLNIKIKVILNNTFPPIISLMKLSFLCFSTARPNAQLTVIDNIIIKTKYGSPHA